MRKQKTSHSQKGTTLEPLGRDQMNQTGLYIPHPTRVPIWDVNDVNQCAGYFILKFFLGPYLSLRFLHFQINTNYPNMNP